MKCLSKIIWLLISSKCIKFSILDRLKIFVINPMFLQVVFCKVAGGCAIAQEETEDTRQTGKTGDTEDTEDQGDTGDTEDQGGTGGDGGARSDRAGWADMANSF